MKVCICHCVSDKELIEEIHKTPWITKQDPFSETYVTVNEQAWQHVRSVLKVGTKCANCEIFIKQIIRDALNRHPPDGM